MAIFDSFNSRPLKEVDVLAIFCILLKPLSIHDLSRRSTRSSTEHTGTRRDFQFTTSQGGRHYLKMPTVADIVFQFTTSQGGRRRSIEGSRKSKYLSIHDLSRRSTILNTVNTDFQESFNSRPLKEVDDEYRQLCVVINLSIHDLSRRSTIKRIGHGSN